MFWMPFFGPSFGYALAQAKRNEHSKVLCIVHNMIPHEPKIIDKPFASYFVKKADYFLVMSDAVKKVTTPLLKDQPIHLARHPIYDSYGDLVPKAAAQSFLNLKSGTRYVLFFGFIRAYKGLDLLIKAMDDAYFHEHDIKLVIAGEYYEKEEQYRVLIDGMQYPDRVIEKTFFIPDNEVRYYFGAADLVAQTYKSATQSGISQLAIYFEKPMVVTDVGGLKEIIGRGGHAVDVDVTAIRSAIISFFENQESEQMVEEVKSLKQQYSWGRFYTEMMSLLAGRHQ